MKPGIWLLTFTLALPSAGFGSWGKTKSSSKKNYSSHEDRGHHEKEREKKEDHDDDRGHEREDDHDDDRGHEREDDHDEDRGHGRGDDRDDDDRGNGQSCHPHSSKKFKSVFVNVKSVTSVKAGHCSKSQGNVETYAQNVGLVDIMNVAHMIDLNMSAQAGKYVSMLAVNAYDFDNEAIYLDNTRCYLKIPSLSAKVMVDKIKIESGYNYRLMFLQDEKNFVIQAGSICILQPILKGKLVGYRIEEEDEVVVLPPDPIPDPAPIDEGTGGDSTPVPPEDNSSLPVDENTDVTEPAPGEGTVLLPDDSASDPIDVIIPDLEDVINEDLDGSIIIPDEGQTTTPVDEGQTTTPVDEGQTTTPVDEGQTTNPVDEGQTTNPVDEGQTTTPVDGEGTVLLPDDTVTNPIDEVIPDLEDVINEDQGGPVVIPDEGGSTTIPDDGSTTTPETGDGTVTIPEDTSTDSGNLPDPSTDQPVGDVVVEPTPEPIPDTTTPPVDVPVTPTTPSWTVDATNCTSTGFNLYDQSTWPVDFQWSNYSQCY